MENHAKYGDSIYFHDDTALYVNLFIASEVNWRENGVQIIQQTKFPDEARTQLTIQVVKPTSFTLRIRQPSWCAAASIAINGEKPSVHRTPGTYVDVQRTWRNGDRIEIDLPMQLHLEPLPTAPQIAALMYGPIVLAGRLGTQGVVPGADLIVNERKSGEMLNIPRELPTWQLDRDHLDAQINRSDHPSLRFRARGVADLPQLELIPYYSIAHERYNMYWRLT